MKTNKLLAIAAGLVLTLSFAACADDSSSDGQSTSGENSSQAQTQQENSQSSNDTDTSSADNSDNGEQAQKIDYDPNGDVRLYDALKDKYYGAYKLTCTTEAADGSVIPYVFEVKGDLAYAERTVMGMTSKRYITDSGDLYEINEGTTTYTKINADELGNTAAHSVDFDLLFAATGDFKSAAVDEAAGEITETYGFTDEYIKSRGADGDAGMNYVFDAKTGNLVKMYSTLSGETAQTVSNIVVSEPVDDDFVLPDLSAYSLS